MLCVSSLAWAETEAEPSAKHALSLIVPEGLWVVQIEARKTTLTRRYNEHGDKESFAADLDNVSLDGTVFPALALLGAGVSLGTTALTTDVTSNREKITLGYGITEDFTAGVIFEYAKNQSQVGFGMSDGTVGFNPLFNAAQAVGVTNFPFAPVGAGVSPVGAEGVQNILTSPVFGYEYKRAQSTTISGIGDPVIGGLWRAYEDDNQSVVLGAAVRIGMAKADDPDNLFDVVVTDGSDDAFVQVDYFSRLGAGFDLQLKTVRIWQFEDTRTMRVPAPGQSLATLASKEDLTRNLGDYWTYDIALGKIIGDWRLGATWHRYQKKADTYTSRVGTDTTALSENTNILADQWRLSASWSGIDAWQQGSIPLPLIVKLEIQDTYRGQNMPDVFDTYLLITTLF